MTGDRPRTSLNRGCSPGDVVSPLAMSTSLHNNLVYSSVKGRNKGPGPQTRLELPDGKRPNPQTSITRLELPDGKRPNPQTSISYALPAGRQGALPCCPVGRAGN